MNATRSAPVIPSSLRSVLAVGLALIMAGAAVGCGNDNAPTAPAGSGEEEVPPEARVELFLTARDLRDQSLTPNLAGEINVAVNEEFELEVSYADLRPSGEDTGAFRILTDILASQEGILEPVLSEVLRLIVGGEIVAAVQSDPTGALDFAMEGSGASYESPGEDFVTDPTAEVIRAMSAFGFTVDQDYSLRMSTVGSGGGTPDVVFEIHWDLNQYGGVDAPDLIVSARFDDPVPTQLQEFSPVGPDGVTLDTSALPWNVDVSSRTYNGGEEFFANDVRGGFDPTLGFTEVGGIGPVMPGGVRELTDDGGFIEPFEAFSLRVRIVAPVTGLVLTLQASPDDEAVLLYGRDDALAANEIYTDGDHQLRLNAVPQ